MEVPSRPAVIWGHYVFAILATTLAGLVRVGLTVLFAIQAPFSPFILAVLVTARYCGLLPGLVATGLGAALGSFLFVRPSLTTWTEPAGVRLSTSLFVVVGVTASWLCGALHAARRRTEEQQRQLTQAHQQAELVRREADRRKDEFLAILAHELRNPLAPIRNALELVRQARGDAELIEQARGLMDRQLGHLVRIVDDLLEVGRITTGKLQLRKERIELQTVLSSGIEVAQPLIAASAHELTVTVPDEPIYLDADPTRLAQVIANLLTNAAKYTEKGGHIWITAERQGQDAAISVRDTGVGIPAEHLPRLFEMFSQVRSTLERSQGGLGIGLSLVKGLVELHGGSVHVRSAGPGKGCEFTIRVPSIEIPVPSSPVPSDLSPLSPARSRRRILVVDDNRDAADSLALMLSMMGHDIRTAYDGIEAIQAAAAVVPDVVLLDIGLPRMNGYEAARHIRGQPWGKTLPLIALTGWGQEEDKRRSLEAGFDHHLTKPVEVATLDQLLARLGPAK